MKLKTLMLLSAAAMISFASCDSKGEKTEEGATADSTATEEVKEAGPQLLSTVELKGDEQLGYVNGELANGTFATADKLAEVELTEGKMTKVTFFNAEGKKIAEGASFEDENMKFFDAEGNEITDNVEKFKALESAEGAMTSLMNELTGEK